MSYEYRSRTEAYEEACDRLSDDDLQQKIAEYLGCEWAPGFEQRTDTAFVLAPYLARAATSEINYQKEVSSSGVRTQIATYGDTAFVTANPEVVAAYRPPLRLPSGQYRRGWTVAPENRPGPLVPTRTIYGTEVLDYWANIRAAVYEDNGLTQQPVVDFSGWYDSQARRFGWRPGGRNKAPAYYMAAMALYASGRAVLYDTPPTEFFGRVMQPAIDRVKAELGVEPIIVCGPPVSAPDWVDLSFLDGRQVDSLITKGTI